MVIIKFNFKLPFFCLSFSILQHCPASVNMKHYRSFSNFGLVGPLISFWQLKQLSVGVANNKLHTLPHPHVVNNAHLVT